MRNSDVENPEAPSQRQNFSDRFFLRADHLGKIFLEFFDDLITLLIQIFGTVGAAVASALSGFLGWTIAKATRKKSNFLFAFIAALVGSAVVAVTFVCVLVILLFAGTLGGILGLRNLGEYSWKEQAAAWVFFLILLFMAPLVLREYALFKISLIFAYTLGVIGLDFLYGQCGILSLGHSGFLLLSGYVTTWLCNGLFGFEFPLAVSITIAALSMTLIGAILGIPSLRVKDYYLVIITMTFTIAIPKVLKSQHMSSYSGLREGGLALREVKFPSFLSSFSVPTLSYFSVMLPSLVLIYFAYHIIHHTQIGRAFRTIRCDQEVSMIMGIPVVKYKLLAFVMSAFYAGVSGGLLTMLSKFIFPDSYLINNSIDALVANIVGGPGSLLGSVFGGAFLAYEQDLTQFMANILPRGKDLARASYGIALILIIIFAPRGVAGELTAWIRTKFSARFRRGAYYISPPPDYDYLEVKKRTFSGKGPPHE